MEMENARIIPIIAVIIGLSGAVIVYAVRSIWREMMDLAEKDDAQVRRTEERKNERIRRELKRRTSR